MLFTQRMKRIELLVGKADLDAVMRYLGLAKCLQIIPEAHEQAEASAEERELAELRTRVQALAGFLGVEPSDRGTGAPTLPKRAELVERAQALFERTRTLVERERSLLQRRLGLRQTAEELSAFARVPVALGDLERLEYLTFRAGSVAEERMEELEKSLGKRALLFRLERPGSFLAVTPKKGRWALDSELRKLDCQPLRLPEGMKGVPADMLRAVEADLAGVDADLAALEAQKRAAGEAHVGELRFLLEHLELDTSIDAVKPGLSSSRTVQRVCGWIPARRLPEVVAGLTALTGGKIAVRSSDPEELAGVRSGTVKVPVLLPHGRLLRAFDRMVQSYSVPRYGSIDPTPFVAVMFVILFAIMFGDVGQGFIGVLLGLVIMSGRIKAFGEYRKKHFGTVFVVVGAASMAAGLMYGSCFANESLLVPVTRWATSMLLGRPLDRIISLAGFQRILVFFGVTVGIGALINSVGLLINIVNNLRRRDWENAILSKTGIAGAFFFWYVLAVAVRVLRGGGFTGFDLAVLALPLLALFFREPIVHLARRHRPIIREGLFVFIMEGIVEMLEAAIYYVSNSVSFLRVAAFALAHTVLSTIVFMLAGMAGGAPGGIVFQVLIVVVGNSIIIVLEGLIVTIQVVRLQYYEFFSKFFNESGEEFTPFMLRTSGGSR
jgi:V/A-type H+-transporting ATPase subunit I